MCSGSSEAEQTFFKKSAQRLQKKNINTGVMDCESPLPTGENALKRFKLKKSIGDPVIIVAANMKKPKQVLSFYQTENKRYMAVSHS